MRGGRPHCPPPHCPSARAALASAASRAGADDEPRPPRHHHPRGAAGALHPAARAGDEEGGRPDRPPHRRLHRRQPLLPAGHLRRARPHCTPRGDAPGFIDVLDETTLALPDRRGNNRIDALRDIIDNPAVALLFLVPGAGETLRVAGQGRLTADPALRERYTMQGRCRPPCCWWRCARCSCSASAPSCAPAVGRAGAAARRPQHGRAAGRPHRRAGGCREIRCRIGPAGEQGPLLTRRPAPLRRAAPRRASTTRAEPAHPRHAGPALSTCPAASYSGALPVSRRRDRHAAAQGPE
ncbi:pyridoxamine 5'-phosphate oxidase family protein [Teichococcus aestuarii]|uniref:pyridoxamine 5'-phosphate oxidase family protein n=1 Tax=Teichococcus aestuarii TaxID=568898 RepID=UPI00361EF1E6